MRTLVLLALIVLCGCTGTRPPTITVIGVEIADRTDEALQLDFTLDLTNPNEDALKLLQFDYTLAVDGNPVYTGRRAAQATLNWTGSRQIVVPAVVPFRRTGWGTPPPASFDYALNGSLLYVTPGQIAEVLLDSGLRRPRVRFADRGTVAVRSDGTVPASESAPISMSAPAFPFPSAFLSLSLSPSPSPLNLAQGPTPTTTARSRARTIDAVDVRRPMRHPR